MTVFINLMFKISAIRLIGQLKHAMAPLQAQGMAMSWAT